MTVSRRKACQTLASVPLVPCAATSNGWTTEWNRAIVRAAVEYLDAQFDSKESMLAREVGSEYHYHTNVRANRAHPTRDSLDYAFLLLEAGEADRRKRALAVIDRVISLQETDPASKWYGIWGYYMEEPAPKMSPADWNWADFNGSLLLLIEYRHGARLPGPLRARVRESIRHAAASVRRRNVSMSYTNIAVQGTFVTLATAQLLKDDDLWRYASERLGRFARTVDETGSFAEYNSPTYANVTIANLTRIRMTVKDAAILKLADRIHTRAWLHLGRHWHFETRQLAGPLSRCYSTDIGAPLWVQKALGGRLEFVTLEQIRAAKSRIAGEIGTLDYRCPAEVEGLFLKAQPPRQHREIFLAAKAPVRPVQGTTWIEKDFSLGSANRGDFWVQRRSLLGYWGNASRPARYAQLRMMKDDYDFASGLLYTAQGRGCVAGLMNFRYPGGDKHPSIDIVKDGAFTAARLRLRLDLAGVPASALILADQKRVAVDLGGAKLWFQVRKAVFGSRAAQLVVAREEGMLTISLDLFKAPPPATIRWSEVGTAWVAFTLAMDGAAGSLEAFDRRCISAPARVEMGSDTATLTWKTPAGELSVAGSTVIAPVGEQDRVFVDKLNGAPVPLVRLSEIRLAD